MPGLIRGVARTAVVAGTATAVSNNVSRRQQGRWADKDQQQYEQQLQAEQAAAYQQQQAMLAAQQQAAAAAAAVPAPVAAAPASDLVGELQKLAELKAAGILSDAEFDAAKAKLLAS
jgi:transcription initiation factor TFIID subunit TAF12